jgi:CubicO group peptidase (beta-lactamase class C family)
MKKTRWLWLLGSALFALIVGVIASQNAARETDHIPHIENGLLTAIVIKGEPAPMKMAERMAYYGVPGVSIAVIKNGKLEWAKGYGVREPLSAIQNRS